MTISDCINAGFEMFGSLAVWMNIRKLHRDKQVRGICWQLSFFFSSWGLWNLYYYFMLRQYLSWVCSMSLALANLIWLGQAVYYKYEEGRNITENRIRFRGAYDASTKVMSGCFYCSCLTSETLAPMPTPEMVVDAVDWAAHPDRRTA